MENVEEFAEWGPLIDGPKGLQPDPDRRGETFQKWCRKLRGLGGKIEKRELRACDYGAPTIRKRLFVIIRFDGQKIIWPEPTHGSPDDRDVIAGRRLLWRIAAECIDWSIACPSIFDTSKEIFDKYGLRSVRPLADATLSRVARGMKRYVLDALRPFLVNVTHGARLEDMAQPFNTITGANRGEKAVIAPIVTAAQHGGSLRSPAAPIHTIAASNKDQNSIIVPTLASSAFIARQFGTSTGHAIDVPSATVMADGAGKSQLIMPYLAQHNNDSRREGGVNPGRSIEVPLSTITQTGSHQNVVAPFLHAYYGSDQDTPAAEPFHTLTTKPRFSHVEATLSAPPFTEAQEARARQVADFMRSHGFWDDREFVTVEIDGQLFVIVDIGMRMLTPRELYNAQGFPPGYKIDGAWRSPAIGHNGGPDWVPFSKSVQVSCVGNSVSPPVARALVSANCNHLAIQREAA